MLQYVQRRDFPRATLWWVGLVATPDSIPGGKQQTKLTSKPIASRSVALQAHLGVARCD